MKIQAYQQCITSKCGEKYDVFQQITECEKCGSLLDVNYDMNPDPELLKEAWQKWCSEHSSCNLEITKNVIKK